MNGEEKYAGRKKEALGRDYDPWEITPHNAQGVSGRQEYNGEPHRTQIFTDRPKKASCVALRGKKGILQGRKRFFPFRG